MLCSLPYSLPVSFLPLSLLPSSSVSLFICPRPHTQFLLLLTYLSYFFYHMELQEDFTVWHLPLPASPLYTSLSSTYIFSASLGLVSDRGRNMEGAEASPGEGRGKGAGEAYPSLHLPSSVPVYIYIPIYPPKQKQEQWREGEDLSSLLSPSSLCSSLLPPSYILVLLYLSPLLSSL